MTTIPLSITLAFSTSKEIALKHYIGGDIM